MIEYLLCVLIVTTAYGVQLSIEYIVSKDMPFNSFSVFLVVVGLVGGGLLLGVVETAGWLIAYIGGLF